MDVDGLAGVDAIPTGKHYSAMPAWALLNRAVTKGAFLGMIQIRISDPKSVGSWYMK